MAYPYIGSATVGVQGRAGATGPRPTSTVPGHWRAHGPADGLRDHGDAGGRWGHRRRDNDQQDVRREQVRRERRRRRGRYSRLGTSSSSPWAVGALARVVGRVLLRGGLVVALLGVRHAVAVLVVPAALLGHHAPEGVDAVAAEQDGQDGGVVGVLRLGDEVDDGAAQHDGRRDHEAPEEHEARVHVRLVHALVYDLLRVVLGGAHELEHVFSPEKELQSCEKSDYGVLLVWTAWLNNPLPGGKARRAPLQSGIRRRYSHPPRKAEIAPVGQPGAT